VFYENFSENSTEISPKTKPELPWDLAALWLDICTKEMKLVCWKGMWTPMLTAALFTITKTWNQCKWPLTEEWKKKCDIYTYIYEYFNIKKLNPIIFGDIDEPKVIILSEISSYGKINTAYSHSYV
jgi:hypothetical protein